jgi:dolichol-phosphate mannosyltransferase
MVDNHTSVSIVVPTYREAANVEALVTEIADSLAATGDTYEILIVDDDSRDGTDAIVARMSERYPVRLIKRSGRRDLSLAVIEGLEESQGQACVVMDADLSHPPARIPDLLAALRDGETDFVIGSRFVPGGRTEDWGGSRRLNSYVATLLCRPLAGKIHDPMAGFFALARSTFQRAEGLDPIGYKIGLELICRCGCKHVVEVPIVFHDRVKGESKLDLEQQARYLLHLDRLYRSCRPGWGVVIRPIIWGMLLAIRVLQSVPLPQKQ